MTGCQKGHAFLRPDVKTLEHAYAGILSFPFWDNNMDKIKAVLWDLDGVIMDTEKDGHRVAFNMAFKDFGFTDDWAVDYYHELLQVGGGKERMKRHWETRGFSKPVPPDQIETLIKQMHERKTRIFIDLIKQGKLPLRPGVHRFMREAVDAGLRIGLCTTSSPDSAMAVIENNVPDIVFDAVLAGDVVTHKKPDPEIYNLALSQLQLGPEEAFAVEDSRNGVLAAKGAGLRVLVTTNGYTEQEDVSMGDIIVTCLGNSSDSDCQLRKGQVPFNGVLRLKDVVTYFEQESQRQSVG